MSDDDVDERIDRSRYSGKVDAEDDEFVGDTFSDDEEYSSGEEVEEKSPVAKRPRNALIDVEAHVDREDEEEDYEDDEDYLEDDFINEAPEAADYEKIIASKPRRAFMDESFDVDQEVARIKREHGTSRRTREYLEALTAGEGVDDTEALFLTENMLKPTVMDPKLWLVKCKPGSERELCIGLLRKHFNLSSTEHPLLVKSALYKENLKGYVYVEAYKLADVIHAIRGFHHAYESKIKLVPIAEMPQVLRVPKRDPPVKPDTWARLRRGKYTGDLCQVLGINEATMTAYVRFVPRLDIYLSGAVQPPNKVAGKASKAYWMQNRAPARLFDPKQVAEYTKNFIRRGSHWIYNGDAYTLDGHLEKEIKWPGLITAADGMTPPSLEEVVGFLGLTLESGIDSAAIREALGKLPPAMAVDAGLDIKGLCIGDLVEVVSGDLTNTLGTIKSVSDTKASLYDPVSQRTYTVPVEHLRKQYKIGDAVQVTSGKHYGKDGLITDVKEGLLTIYSEATQEQVQVLFKDVAGLDDGSTTAFKRPSLTPQEVAYSPAAGLPAAVPLTGFAGSMAAQRNTVGSYGRGGTLGRAYAYQRFKRDPYLEKTVVIAAGPYKGQLGIVKESDGVETLEIELQTTSKQVSVMRTCVTLADGSVVPLPREEERYGGSTPFYSAGNKTPGLFHGAQTPGYKTPGYRTPAASYGLRTPGHKTPADTLSVYSAVDVSNKTPGWSTGSRSTSNPYGAYDPTPKTSNQQWGSATPLSAGQQTPTGWKASEASAAAGGWKAAEGSSTPSGWKAASDGSATPSGWKAADGSSTPSGWKKSEASAAGWGSKRNDATPVTTGDGSATPSGWKKSESSAAGWNQQPGSATPVSVNNGSSTPAGWKKSESSSAGWKASDPASNDGSATPTGDGSVTPAGWNHSQASSTGWAQSGSATPSWNQ